MATKTELAPPALTSPSRTPPPPPPAPPPAKPSPTWRASIDRAVVRLLRAARRSTRPHRERWIVAAIIVAALALKFAYIQTRIDSDEPQHLHVAWCWAAGFVPYRDFFDNHAPLFHMLSSIPLAGAKPRPDIVLRARLTMLPLGLAMLALTYGIGVALSTRRATRWAVALVAVFPVFFEQTLEFRPDNPWAVLWLAALWIIARDKSPTAMTGLAVGALIGLCLAMSAKTILLVAGLSGAALIVLAIELRRRPSVTSPRRVALIVTSFALVGFAAAAVPLVAYLARRGILTAMYDSVFRHNANAPWHWQWDRLLVVPTMAACVWETRLMLRGRLTRRALLVFLATGLSAAAFWVASPLVNHQDYTPLLPIALLAATSALGKARRAGPSWIRSVMRTVLPLPWTSICALVSLGLCLFLLVRIVTRRRGISEQQCEQLIADVLWLTTPEQLVVDHKGDSVYRARAIWQVMESVTRRQIRRGRMRDDLVEQMIGAHAVVVCGRLDRYTRRADRFIAGNFLPVDDNLAVAGLHLPPRAARGRQSVELVICIGASYAAVSDSAVIDALVDGEPLTRKGRYLAAGRHQLQPRGNCSPSALIWSRAARVGFLPRFDLSPGTRGRSTELPHERRGERDDERHGAEPEHEMERGPARSTRSRPPRAERAEQRARPTRAAKERNAFIKEIDPPPDPSNGPNHA